jgi:HK97 family phage prohead protease
MSKTKSVKNPVQSIETRLLKDSIDTEKRTVKMVFTSEKPVKTYRWKGWDIEEFNEILSMEPGHMRRSRLDKGAVPLLNSHNQYDLSAQLGVVLDAQPKGKLLEGDVKFSKRASVQEIFDDVVDGVISNGSVGYRVYKYEDVSTDGDKIPTLKAVDWELLEMSLVPVGADENAGTMNGKRAAEIENDMNDCEIILRNEKVLETRTLNSNQTNLTGVNTMPKSEQTPEMVAAEKAANEAKALAVETERNRCLSIREAVKTAGFNEDMADDYIKRGSSIEDVKTNIDLLKKYSAENRPVASANAEIIVDEMDKKREALTESVLARVDQANFKVTEKSRLFYGKHILRQLEDYIGRRPTETDREFAKRAMSTSDLPLILANVAEKAAQKRYAIKPRSFTRWTSSGTLRNFKEASQVRAGDFGSLEEMNELGEFTQSAIGEEGQKVKLKRYGKVHSFSYEMLVNDDLDLIMKVASETGLAASRLENKLVYDVLINNPEMDDGEDLFSSAHGNLGTTGAISETTFNEAFKKMRDQTSVDSEETLNLAPSFLIVGSSLETAAKKFLATVIAAQTSNVNVFSNSVELVVESLISDDKYFFAASPSEIDTVKMYRLEGQESPRVESRINWNNDAMELKASHAAAASAPDYRGLVKNKAT